MLEIITNVRYWALSGLAVLRDKAMQIGDLEWLCMPALINQQFYLFRDDDTPIRLALWAKCNAAAAKKLDGGIIEPENRLTLEEWSNRDQMAG